MRQTGEWIREMAKNGQIPQAVRRVMQTRKKISSCVCLHAPIWSVDMHVWKALQPCATPSVDPGISRHWPLCLQRTPGTLMWLTCWWRWIDKSSNEKVMPQAQNSIAARKCQNTVVRSVGTFTYFPAMCQENNPTGSTGREILPKLNSVWMCTFLFSQAWHQMPSKEWSFTLSQYSSWCLLLK